jgi:hypothetical protein
MATLPDGMESCPAFRAAAAALQQAVPKNKTGQTVSSLPQKWCSREDSNLHRSPYMILSHTRLPIPPREQNSGLDTSRPQPRWQGPFSIKQINPVLRPWVAAGKGEEFANPENKYDALRRFYVQVTT